jgi:Fic family protein
MDGSGRTVYTPPDDPRVLELLLKDWESFANDQTVDPLIRMAIGHYQFESIHPFPNGNGRTGRILNLLVLETAGLLNKPVLHLSREIKDHAQEYYDLLRYTTSSGDYVPWTRYMLDRVIAASNIGLLQLEMLSDYMEELHKVTHPAFKNGIPYSYLNQIATVPYTKTVSVMAACDASRPTATKWLHALVSLGYLQESTHNRTKYFINTRLLRILNPA